MKEVDSSPTPERTFTIVHVFFCLFILTAGALFFFKLFAFLSTIRKDELAGFAFDPIITYGFVAMGFLCLLVWAYMSGQFRGIEDPKREMLERFFEQEAHDRRYFGEETR